MCCSKPGDVLPPAGLLDPGLLRTEDFELELRRSVFEHHGDGELPAYYFHLRRLSDRADMGWLDLRAGDCADTALYGHLSYFLARPFRGRGYITRAVPLLYPLARRHGLTRLYIHLAPDNDASRRVCQRLQAIPEGEQPQPEGGVRLRYTLPL